MAEVNFKKAEGRLTTTITEGKLSVTVSFPASRNSSDEEVYESLLILDKILETVCGTEESLRLIDIFYQELKAKTK